MRTFILVFVAALTATSAGASPITGAARDALTGGWRADGCGAQANANAANFTLEFALTGGRIFVDSGDEASGAHAASIDQTGGVLTITLDKRDKWRFTRKGDALVSTAPPPLYSGLKDQVFHRCQEPADRSAIHLNAAQTSAISSTMPDGPVLIDLRAKRGCAAIEYQYLDFDLVGPVGFVLHRWNSLGLGEKLADGGKPAFATDEISDFTIDKAEATPQGYRFTVTELIPPNGSRGDTMIIDVVINKDGTATIPQWKRRYARCTHPQ